MQKLFVLFLILPFFSIAQHVGIGTQAPHSSSVLELASTEKGLLIPRMTTLQRTSIAGPAIGLTVFDNETYSFWVYRGDVMGGWREMLLDFDKRWQLNGTNIYNLNSGNVGIGTNNPSEKLSLNALNATMQFMNSGTPRGYLQTNGADMRLGTYVNNTTGNIVFNTKAVDRMWIDENGRVGIGTATPASLLTINGTNPYLQLQHNNENTGFVQAVGVNLKIGTNSTNTTGNLIFQTKLIDRLTIDENGQVGIGTTSPTSILTVNSANPIIQLKNGGVDKGYIQLVDDDIKIGTNTANSFGKFMIRTDGQDRLSVDRLGKVEVGNGDVGSLVIDSENPLFRLERNNIDLFYAYASSLGNKDVTLARNSQVNSNGYLIISNGVWGRIYLSEDGHINMGVGKKPAGYKLSVEGKVIATDFTTSAIANWPDYVFGNEYQLKPLADVKAFISENKHLPNIPSASEIEKNGIQLGDMTKRLMEKVEELTLYIIDLQEQMDVMKKTNQNKVH